MRAYINIKVDTAYCLLCIDNTRRFEVGFIPSLGDRLRKVTFLSLYPKNNGKGWNRTRIFFNIMRA